MNQMAREGMKKFVTAINSCSCLWTGDSWRQVCTNCGVVTGTPNTQLCRWITHTGPSTPPFFDQDKIYSCNYNVGGKKRAPVAEFSGSLEIMTWKRWCSEAWRTWANKRKAHWAALLLSLSISPSLSHTAYCEENKVSQGDFPSQCDPDRVT